MENLPETVACPSGRGVPIPPPTFAHTGRNTIVGGADFHFPADCSIPITRPSGIGIPIPPSTLESTTTPTFRESTVSLTRQTEEQQSKANFKPPIRIEDFPYPMRGSYREAITNYVWRACLVYMLVLCILESAKVFDRDGAKVYWLFGIIILAFVCLMRVLLFSYLDTVQKRDNRRLGREALLGVKNDYHRRMRSAWLKGRTADRLFRPPVHSGDTFVVSNVVKETLRVRESRNEAARKDGRCPFGERMKKKHFLLRNHFLNTASYGATPISVQNDKTQWDKAIQVNPSAFMRYHVDGLLTKVVNRLSKIVNSNPEDTVLTVNANQATSSVLKGLPWEIGDRLLIYSCEYDATINAANWLRLHEGVETVTIELTLPMSDDDIINKTRSYLEEAKRSEPGLPKLANFCHVTSKTASIFPAKRMVALFHSYDIPVVVDGAQAPGHLDLDINDIDADWYIGTLHKWMYSCQGAAFLVTKSDKKYCTIPLDISQYSGRDYKTEFLKAGGIHDWSTWLSAEAAFDFVDITCGGWDNVRKYCGGLATNVVKLYASSWGGKVQQGAKTQYGNLPIITLPEGSPVTQILTVGAMTNNPPISAFFLYSFDGNFRAVRCCCQIHTSLADFIQLERYVNSSGPTSTSRFCPCFPNKSTAQTQLPASQKLT